MIEKHSFKETALILGPCADFRNSTQFTSKLPIRETCTHFTNSSYSRKLYFKHVIILKTALIHTTNIAQIVTVEQKVAGLYKTNRAWKLYTKIISLFLADAINRLPYVSIFRGAEIYNRRKGGLFYRLVL